MPPHSAGPNAGGERGFPIWLSPAERLRVLLAFAVLAPSRHNSQPWLFDITGPEVRISTDARRALPHADPEGRERVMACGAALENLCIAAAAYGQATSVEVLAGIHPDGALARVRLEEHRRGSGIEEALFRAMARRRNSRVAFEERGAPAGLVTTLAREARERGALLRAVEEGCRAAVAELIVEADRVQWADPGFAAELDAWSRRTSEPHGDGLPPEARGRTSPESLLDRFLGRRSTPRRASEEERRDRQYALHGPVLVVLSTAGDAARDWLAAGRAFQRVLLLAASTGLAASCFSAAIEVPEVRTRLRVALGETAFPQVVFRLGYATAAARPTPRRSVDDVLRYYGNDAPSHALALRER
jgi:nitroreductase